MRINNLKRWSLLLVCLGIGISFLLMGCTQNSSKGEPFDEGISDSTIQTSDMETDHTDGEVETMRAVIKINGVEYGMTITDTTIGRAFAKKIQEEGTYTVTGYRSTNDICCSESEIL